MCWVEKRLNVISFLKMRNMPLFVSEIEISEIGLHATEKLAWDPWTCILRPVSMYPAAGDHVSCAR